MTPLQRIILAPVLAFSIFGCSQTQTKPDPLMVPLAKEIHQVKERSLYVPHTHLSGGIVLHPRTSPLETEVEVMGTKLKHTDFDIPVVINSNVLKWVDYFTGRGRKLFEVYLHRSEYFIPYLKESLTRYEMPHDLVYLAMIESGYNTRIRSHARAVGTWQFISATGKRYGLKVGWWVDERKDVKKSTRAAIRYLRDLHDVFQSWELAAAAYNAGEYKVSRAIQRFGTMNYWTLVRQRFLRPETRNYVPKLMAAAIVAKNRVQFGFKDKYVDENQSEEELQKEANDLELQQAMLQASSDQDLIDILETYDESYLRQGRPTPAKFVSTEAPHTNPVPYLTRKGEIGGEELVEIEIQSPADLMTISKAAGIPYKKMKKYNPEILRWCTPPDVDRYRIKIPKANKAQFLAKYNHPAYPREVRFRKYKVRRGDSLRRIARRFGISILPLQSLNGFSKNPKLKRGEYILLPMPVDRTRSIKSLDLRDPPRRRRYRKKRRYRRVEAPISVKQTLIAKHQKR